ncbi:MAG: V-type ATP synthase subunit D [Candidatus Altarchaeaceae archaeon]
MAQQVSPTRMELLKIKQKIKLAKKGHELLKKKRDALSMHLYEVAKSMENVREEIFNEIREGYKTLIKAEALEGPLSIRSIADSSPQVPDINFKWKNIAGVRIPSDISILEEKNKEKINYGTVLTSSALDNSIEKFTIVRDRIADLFRIEEAIIRLSKEIIKTKRRVNSLEYILIPRLEQTQRNIKAKLEEMAREDFFRLKMVKRKKSK